VLFSSAFGLANAIGPSLGGFLSQHYGWRFAFLVNIPVGLVSLYLAARHLPHIRQTRIERLSADWRGALLIMVALGALQLLVEAMGQTGRHAEATLYGAIAVVSLSWLVREERRASNPVIPPALLKERATVVLLMLSMLMGVAMFVLLFYVPLLLQGGMGLDADEAGLVVTPLVVCITLGTISNTRIVTRLKRPNLLLYVGFGLLGGSCAALAQAGANGHGAVFIGAMAMAGVGIGFVMPNLTVFAQQVAGRTQLGISTALIQSARMVGGMFGTAVAGTVLRDLYRTGLANAIPGAVDPATRHSIAALGDPQLLMSAHQAARFVSQADAAGQAGEAMLSAARNVLVHAVGTSMLGVAVLMGAACLILVLLPLIPVASPSKGSARRA
jgi:predicted MFS family arabinose efflux permease